MAIKAPGRKQYGWGRCHRNDRKRAGGGGYAHLIKTRVCGRHRYQKIPACPKYWLDQRSKHHQYRLLLWRDFWCDWPEQEKFGEGGYQSPNGHPRLVLWRRPRLLNSFAFPALGGLYKSAGLRVWERVQRKYEVV